MKIINVKDHTNKYMNISKKAAEGVYPSKRIAKIGSTTGLGVGGALTLLGIYAIIKGSSYGTGILIAGTATSISNVINLKRLNLKAKNRE